MDRTRRAALVSVLSTFGLVLALGLFLGFPLDTSLVTATVSALIAGGLLFAAARRADSFHTPASTDPTSDLDATPTDDPDDPGAPRG